MYTKEFDTREVDMTYVMKKKYTLVFFMLLYSLYACGNPFYDFRSQSVNLARDLVGLQTYMTECHTAEERHSYCAITPCYTQTFNGNQIATCLFGSSIVKDCNKSELLIQGSLIPNRDPQAWLADYFGLPTDFQGSISMNPSISTFLVDCNAYFGLDCLGKGLYFYAHAPLVYTKWDLAMHECSKKGVNGYKAGYFNAIATGGPDLYRGASNQELLNHALDFLAYGKVPDLGTATSMEPLCCSRFLSSHHKTTKVGVADFQAVLGWNFVCTPDYDVGVSLRLSIPTGNKPHFSTIFEPIIGSAGHYKLGAGVHLHLALWKNRQETSEVTFHLDGYGQHLFATAQQHCFDLCGKVNSRYMLASRLSTTRLSPSLSGLCDAKVEFQNEYAPVANLTRTTVNVSVALEAEFLATLVFRKDSITFTTGYNFWTRTCHEISKKNRCCPLRIEQEYWALKGDAQVIGFEDITNNPVRLSATESQATIYSGTNDGNQIDNFIDNPCLTDAKNAPNGTDDINSSKPPIIIRLEDINFSGTQGSTNSLFIHLDHAWSLRKYLDLHIGIGAQVEFNGNTESSDQCATGCLPSPTCSTNNGTCDFCTIDQWSVWLKGSLNFH